MTFWKWSTTAANNGTADSTCPFPEGMAPSAVNDGMRGAMAAVAKYRDDIAGAIVTTGSATAYAVSTYQGFDTLAPSDDNEDDLLGFLDRHAASMPRTALRFAIEHLDPDVRAHYLGLRDSTSRAASTRP